ncbi:MAG: alpha/beta hydrolase [Candidatus Roizmanbacteria bacterium]
MKNALILHGTESSSKENWFPWLKTQLEGQGYQVLVPNLPRADKPNPRRYTDFLLHSGFAFNSESIIVGHSSGSVEILHLLPHLQVRIHASYLVGAFKDNDFLKWEPNSELFDEPFNFKGIRSHCEKFIFLHSEDDPFCPLTHASYLATKIGGELTIIPHQKHFSVSTMGEQYRTFPALLERIIAT